MTTGQFFISAWNWNPWVIAICAAAILAHSTRYRPSGWLLAGAVVFFLTLTSPIDTLADGYLFSAHMLQHLLLLLVVPLLILLSLPPSPAPSRWRFINCFLHHPVASWLLGVGGMWLWHAPTLCNAAVAFPWLHRLQYITLLLMGFAYWLPILAPWRQQRLSPLAGIVYLFSGCIGCTVLGIIITFAPVGVCSIYLHPLDRLGILPLIRDQWGLTPAKDQQLGGLLMWVPACLIYFCAIIGLLARWYGHASDETFASESPSKNIPMEKPYVR